MYVRGVSVDVGEAVHAWKPQVPGVAEVFHARFVDHVYPRHTHETWTLFIVDDGQIRYDLDRHRRGAGGAMVGLLPPHVVHDGRPADDRGYRKRVLYLDTTVLDERLIGHAVDRSSVEDRALRRAVAALHRVLRDPDDALEAEGRLAFVVERLVEHLTGREREEPRAGALATGLRELLDARAFERFTLREAGAALGASPSHLVRCFTEAFGVPPHAYVIGRRIEAARPRLLDGEPVARVAAGVGFFDQAHLTRHFKRHVGTTPGRYAASSSSSGRRARKSLTSPTPLTRRSPANDHRKPSSAA